MPKILDANKTSKLHFNPWVAKVSEITCNIGTCVLSSFSHIRLFATLWTLAHQAPPSMEFSRQQYWSGLPFPSPGDLPNPGIEPRSPALHADALPSERPGKPP